MVLVMQVIKYAAYFSHRTSAAVDRWDDHSGNAVRISSSFIGTGHRVLLDPRD